MVGDDTFFSSEILLSVKATVFGLEAESTDAVLVICIGGFVEESETFPVLASMFSLDSLVFFWISFDNKNKKSKRE